MVRTEIPFLLQSKHTVSLLERPTGSCGLGKYEHTAVDLRIAENTQIKRVGRTPSFLNAEAGGTSDTPKKTQLPPLGVTFQYTTKTRFTYFL
jgi:hypothetical protein